MAGATSRARLFLAVLPRLRSGLALAQDLLLSASADDQDAARDEIVDGLAQVVLHVTPTIGLTG